MIILAAVRTLVFIFVSYQSFIFVEVVLDAKPLRFSTHVLLSVINSVASTYLLMHTTFQVTYLLLFAMLTVESVIIYRKSFVKLLCIIEAYILSVMCLRGISMSIFALILRTQISSIAGDTTLLMVSALIPNIIELCLIFLVLRHFPAVDLRLLLKHTVQRRYVLLWLGIYNLTMLLASDVCTPGSRLSFAVFEYLYICVFILFSSYTMPTYTFRLNRAIEIQRKNKSLALELGTQKQLQSVLLRDAIFTTEANLTQNRVIFGLENYADSFDQTNLNYDAWFDSMEPIIHPADYGFFANLLNRHNLIENFNNGVEPLPFEYRRLDQDGKYHWIRLVLRIFKEIETNDVLVFGYVFDIDNEVLEKQELLFQAQMDLFTGLFNKATTEALIGEEIKKGTGILLLLDVDDFKNLNDQLGHEVGDSVLKYVANVLKNCSRETDILGRVGGDEFMVFLKNTNKLAAAEQRADEMLFLLQNEDDYNRRNYPITASIGIAIIDETVENFSDAYKHADIAMYRVKHSHKNGYAVYDALNAVDFVLE